jgi:hypothetical protein
MIHDTSIGAGEARAIVGGDSQLALEKDPPSTRAAVIPVPPSRRPDWRRTLAVFMAALLCAVWPDHVAAQDRTLHWAAIDVKATLDGRGVLHVVETQTLVFNGYWNGGERTFNLRPLQRLVFDSISREDVETGARVRLTENGGLSNVDEYVFTDRRTLRWRSRLSSAPPFEQTTLRYVLRYQLGTILQKQDDRYVLDHDFLFPDRSGTIEQFTLRLALDSSWQPLAPVQERYAGGPIAPGQSFVLAIPLRYTGAGAPRANDGRRPPEIVYAVAAIVGFFVISAGALYWRERSLGRFAPLSATPVTADWIRQHIVSQPAEVVGAVWDDSVGTEEVVALLARMTSEGKLASAVTPGSLALDLKVDRSRLGGYERALVDGLFFDNRTSTSTADVQAHYRASGFDPSRRIGPGLEARVKEFLPDGQPPPIGRPVTIALCVIGFGLLIKGGIDEAGESPVPFVAGVLAIVLAGLLQIPGLLFRTHMDRGVRFMLVGLVPAAVVAAGVSAFLWFRVGTDAVSLPPVLVGALVVLTMWVVRASVNGMKSRHHRAAIAVRKTMTAGRQYFARELQKERPDLRDEWYPWVVAFGLGQAADAWAVRHGSSTRRSGSGWGPTWSSGGTTSDAAAPAPAWSGGGRSGGAGASAGWVAAAAGMAAGVSAPSSSGSSGGGSSSGGSSGGGGGGGW